MKDQRGFTLIEVLVVILIIGVLATVVLVALGDSKKRASDKKVAAQLKSMIPQALLYNPTTGQNILNAVSPTGLNDVSTYTVATTNNGTLFNHPQTNTSLFRLIKGLPKGTMILYAKTAGVATNPAAQWALAASTSTGSVCVDYRQKIVVKDETDPTLIPKFPITTSAGSVVGGTPSLQSKYPNLLLPGTLSSNPNVAAAQRIRPNCD